MSDEKRKIRKWFPHYLGVLSVVMLFVILFIGWMASLFPIPDDAPMVIPMPDDGQNIPGPEWFFLLLWQPFWYFVGMKKKYLVLMTLVPMLVGLFLIFLPFFHKIPLHRIPGIGGMLSKVREMNSGFLKSFIYALPAIIFALILGISVYRSGHQAKILGCDACHNPAMGHRQAIPPPDVAEYYRVDRARQIGVGKYRAGKATGIDEKTGETIHDVGGPAQSYKDSNWQMRHMYEPTFTW